MGGRGLRHYERLNVGRAAPDFCARVRSGRGGLTHKPGTMRGFRDPSICREWRRAPPASEAAADWVFCMVRGREEAP
jgi:hypothetical protein